jgi:hypothetical protein
MTACAQRYRQDKFGGSPADQGLTLLCFMETPEAETAQIGAADDHQVLLPQTPTEPALRIPVRLGPGQLINPHLVHVVVHGLRAGLCREGLRQVLLDLAGCSTTEYGVEGEFLGDLPSRIAACPAAIQVGNSDACLLFIRAPAADRRLSRLPRYFTVGQDRVPISRPGQPDSHRPMPSSDRTISQRILLVTERIAAGLRLWPVLGTALQLRHMRPSWASHRPSWTSAAHSCRLWRQICPAAGHQEWTAGAWAAPCPSPRLRQPPLRASFWRQQQTPWTDGHSAFPQQSATFPYRPSRSHGGRPAGITFCHSHGL